MSVNLSKPNFLVCAPDYFEVIYEINPWMHVGSNPQHDIVQKQWEGVVNYLKQCGAEISHVPMAKGWPDMVYTANAGLVKGNKCVVSTFRYPQRQGEEQYFEAWFEANNFETIKVKNGFFEGAGDALFVGETLCCGYGFRSEKNAYQEVCDFLEVSKHVFIELTDARYYHMDLTICPINDSLALFNPQAMTKESAVALENVCELIAVAPEEAEHFACNAVVMGKDIILPSGAPKLCKELEKRGFVTHPLVLNELMKGGGASKCMVLRIN